MRNTETHQRSLQNKHYNCLLSLILVLNCVICFQSNFKAENFFQALQNINIHVFLIYVTYCTPMTSDFIGRQARIDFALSA